MPGAISERHSATEAPGRHCVEEHIHTTGADVIGIRPGQPEY